MTKYCILGQPVYKEGREHRLILGDQMGQEGEEDRWLGDWEVHNVEEYRPLYFVSLTSMLLFYEYNMLVQIDGELPQFLIMGEY